MCVGKGEEGAVLYGNWWLTGVRRRQVTASRESEGIMVIPPRKKPPPLSVRTGVKRIQSNARK